MKSRLPVMQRIGLSLGLVATALLTAPAPTMAQAAKTSTLTMFGLGPGVQIGVSVRDLDDADAKTAKLAAPAGALVESVRADSPASRAGFRAADVIVTFDGERVRSASHFARLVDETPEGRSVPVVVQRAAERVTLSVAPAPSPRPRAITFNRAPALASRDLVAKLAPETLALKTPLAQSLFQIAGPMRLGVTVQELTGQLGEYFGATSGVLVTAVTDNSPASTAGLKAGDVITRINSQATSNGAELRRAVGQAQGEVTVTVVRDKKEQTMKVTLRDEKPASQPTISR